MFTQFRIQNYKTHLDTTLDLQAMNLLIGANNSGKSNLLEAIVFFVGLMDYFTEKELNIDKILAIYGNRHIIPKCYRNEKVITSFSFVYKGKGKGNQKETSYEVKYEMTLPLYFENNKINFWDKPKEEISAEYTYLSYDELELLEISNYFHLQPDFLKGKYNNDEKQQIMMLHEEEEYVLLSSITENGETFLSVLAYILGANKDKYNLFIGNLKRFEPTFNAISIENEEVLWQFDIGGEFHSFPSHELSDGFIKIAAIVLICVCARKGQLILLEELENGINQKVLADLLKWMEKSEIQFILSSHSPSVIREFWDKLDAVHTVRLKKKNFSSIVSNLNDSLKTLVNLGTIEEDILNEIHKENGKTLYQVRPHKLVELFYNGTLGNL